MTPKKPRTPKIPEMPNPPAKPGYKTTEFWLTIIAVVGPLVIEAIPPEAAAMVGGGATVTYIISRAVAKAFGRP